jgi:hypothetical protein
MRTRTRRLVAALIAPWFAVTAAVPAAAHQCAMHSGGARAAHAEHAALSSHAGHAGHAMSGHQMTAEQHAAMPHDTPAPSHPAACTCDDGCCVVAAVAAPPANLELSFAPASVRREPAPVGGTIVVATATPYALPFANGPPARV